MKAPSRSQFLEWKLTSQPLLLTENRVFRGYLGGKLLEKFRGHTDPQDGNTPEDWVGSTTVARNHLSETEGLSTVSYNGVTFFLKDLIEAFPKEVLGERHTKKFGANSFLLVKLLDSAERLGLQVHPTREKAQEFFGNSHGKTESWIVVETRSIAGEKPYILLGFNERISPEAFMQAVFERRIDALIDMMHRIEVQPGDVFLVPAGIPHAIGPGVFMVEVQEPSDYTIGFETKKDPKTVRPMGLSWEQAFSCFDYTPLSLEETLKKWNRTPKPIAETPGGTEYALLTGPDVDPFFRAHKLVVKQSFPIEKDEFYIAIVIEGTGRIITGKAEQPVKAGDTLFLPAAIGPHRWESLSDQELKVITCHPPV